MVRPSWALPTGLMNFGVIREIRGGFVNWCNLQTAGLGD